MKTDREILEAARASGMFLPQRTVMVNDGEVLRFVKDETLTLFDESLIKFARELVRAERDRCAALAMPENAAHCMRALKGRCHPLYAASEAIARGVELPPEAKRYEQPMR